MQSVLLVIEDDPYVLRFYGRLFRLHQCSVELASSGREGIEIAKKLRPGLIFLDIMMPEMDGLQVLAKLKDETETRDLPVVMLTNYGEEATITKAREMGAADFVIKSQASGDELLAIVKKYLANYEEER